MLVQTRRWMQKASSLLLLHPITTHQYPNQAQLTNREQAFAKAQYGKLDCRGENVPGHIVDFWDL